VKLGNPENDPASADAPGAAPARARVSSIAPEPYGRFYLLERIGRGGMAEIFRAVAPGLEGFRRVFVIKRIRPEKSDSTELVRMFCDEARLCALLHHPNVVQVYDFGQINGTYFLAMEYLRGKDLAGVMRAIRAAKSALEPSIAAYVAQQVATGLHYAHTLKRPDGKPLRIVHRDVTPSNIMLLRAGGVKVLDFGIAQATNLVRQAETGGGRVKGKLAYLSPEQVRLQELDGRSDVFALGVVLWEMLTGQRLFIGENEFVTMRNVLSHPVPPPSSKRPDVPAALDAIVARALERDREARFPTAQAMADELEALLREVPYSSHAIPRLLAELLGEETTDHTPDLPDLSLLSASAGVQLTAPARLPALDRTPAPILEIDADPPSLVLVETNPPSLEMLPESLLQEIPAAAAAATPPQPAAAPVTTPPPPPPVALRRAVGAVAAVTLVACLGWAMWHGKRPAAAAPLASQADPPVAVSSASR
jgi:serine/threonine-protein kinase